MAPHDFGSQFDPVLEVEPAAISFVYGVPPSKVVARSHARGIRIIGTATTVDEAVALEAGGVDVIVATGFEAAGHRVSFMRRAEQSLVGGLALIPQVVDAVTVPVIAAGGIADRRGVAAAFALGAVGVQLAQNWPTGQFRTEAARRDLGELLSLWLAQAALRRSPWSGAYCAPRGRSDGFQPSSRTNSRGEVRTNRTARMGSLRSGCNTRRCHSTRCRGVCKTQRPERSRDRHEWRSLEIRSDGTY